MLFWSQLSAVPRLQLCASLQRFGAMKEYSGRWKVATGKIAGQSGKRHEVLHLRRAVFAHPSCRFGRW